VPASVRMLPIIFHKLSLLVPLTALTDEGYKNPWIGQIHGAHKLPPLGHNLTPFRDSDSAFDFFNITAFPGKEIYLPHHEKKVKHLLNFW
jgi:hypothetical protein